MKAGLSYKQRTKLRQAMESLLWLAERDELSGAEKQAVWTVHNSIAQVLEDNNGRQ